MPSTADSVGSGEIGASAHAADQRHQEQERADIGRDRIAGQAEHVHGAEPAVHQRPAGPHRDLPERQIHALLGESLVHQIVIADRGAAGRHQNVGGSSRASSNRGDGRLQRVVDDAEIGRPRRLPRAPARRAKSRSNRRSGPAPVRGPAAPARRRSRTARFSAGDRPAPAGDSCRRQARDRAR